MTDENRPGESLRERKKRETRQRISNIATGMFRERGFDQVTVAEVARVAGVSAMTVFNYFPRKEDLFLDRIPEAVAAFAGAVRDRAPGEPPLAALRRLAFRFIDARHPLGGLGEGFAGFWSVVADSPALLARAREGVEEVEWALAAAFAEAGLAAPELVAAVTVAAYRSVCVASVRRQLAGYPFAEIVEDHRERMGAAFDALERMVP
ncbi:TetR family transcriptional regulator [Streptomyces sp. GbtcB6]|uniref:TetR/AcrR family transcriptional regulator n=1 Tax=Streptomyces sp. GbtcB6 TaxID=2824751 RepID=UPI0027E4B4A3|nr:TetR family transcriptional regulator [Streptomyces sp. GbtcB6]